MVGDNLFLALGILLDDLHAVKLESVNVIGYDCRPVVFLKHLECHVLELYAVSMAYVESPGRKLLPVGEFRIRLLQLRNGGQVLR